MLNQIYSTVLNLLFYKYHDIKKYFDYSFSSNRKDSNQLKTNLELFYKETTEIKLTNEDQKKTFKYMQINSVD